MKKFTSPLKEKGQGEWLEVGVRDYSAHPVEIALLLLSAGSQGVYLEEKKGLCFHPDFISPEEKPVIYGYFPLTSKETVKYLREKIPAGTVSVRVVKEKDVTHHHENHPGRRIGERFLLVPPWESPDVTTGKIALLPGIAFGNGAHETTQLVMSWMDENSGLFHNSRVLDAGCGTGILSVAAVSLGARKVVGVDVEPRAVHVARFNVHLNGVENQVKIACAGVEHVKGSFDIVLANMLTPVLLRVFDALAELTRPGGRLFITGIMKGEEPPLEKYFQGQLRIIQRRISPQGWLAYELIR